MLSLFSMNIMSRALSICSIGLCALLGCADADRTRVISHVKQLHLPTEASWILSALDHDIQDSIITIHCDPHWHSFNVVERWIDDGRLRYREHKWNLVPPEDFAYITTNALETESEVAIELFGRLQKWPLTHGYDYSPPGSLTPFVYVIIVSDTTKSFAAIVLGLMALEALSEDEWKCASCGTGEVMECDQEMCDDLYCDPRHAFEDPSVFYLQALSYLDAAIECNSSK